VRFAHPRRTVASPLRDSVEMEARAISFDVEKRGELVTLKVLAPLARNVELAADFTGWDPLQMMAAGDGWWVVTRSLPPGKYQVNLRMNGGKWVVPPGLLAMLDEFGGSVGLLIVE
jgi:1,4-alpha-glucan branching enzyme